MYVLWVLGSVIEPAFGSRRFLAIYLISGLFGSVASFMFSARTSPGSARRGDLRPPGRVGGVQPSSPGHPAAAAQLRWALFWTGSTSSSVCPFGDRQLAHMAASSAGLVAGSSPRASARAKDDLTSNPDRRVRRAAARGGRPHRVPHRDVPGGSGHHRGGLAVAEQALPNGVTLHVTDEGEALTVFERSSHIPFLRGAPRRSTQPLDAFVLVAGPRSAPPRERAHRGHVPARPVASTPGRSAAAPRWRRSPPGTVLELFTEDASAGESAPHDLVSRCSSSLRQSAEGPVPCGRRRAGRYRRRAFRLYIVGPGLGGVDHRPAVRRLTPTHMTAGAAGTAARGRVDLPGRPRPGGPHVPGRDE